MSLESLCKRLNVPPPSRSEAIADIVRVLHEVLDRVEAVEQKVAEQEAPDGQC